MTTWRRARGWSALTDSPRSSSISMTAILDFAPCGGRVAGYRPFPRPETIEMLGAFPDTTAIVLWRALLGLELGESAQTAWLSGI